MLLYQPQLKFTIATVISQFWKSPQNYSLISHSSVVITDRAKFQPTQATRILNSQPNE